MAITNRILEAQKSHMRDLERVIKRYDELVEKAYLYVLTKSKMDCGGSNDERFIKIGQKRAYNDVLKAFSDFGFEGKQKNEDIL